MAEPAPKEFIIRVTKLLASRPVQRINFELGHVRVIPERMQAVIRAFQHGRLGLEFDAERLAFVRGEAAYDPDRNVMILQDEKVLDDPWRGSFVVHEAVHAGTDWAGKRTSLVLEEAGAFIAQIWYLQSIGIKELRRPNPSTEVFWDIAKSLRARRRMEPTPIAATQDQVSQAWTAAVAAGYPQIQFNANGID